MSKKIINKKVAVTAVYFKSAKNLDTYPRRIEYEGSTYTFADGVRYLINTGGHLIKLFDMSDGASNFRLRQEAGQPDWTLVAITS